jgi:Tol biopolymer transport system component/serine/threonine protein kinase
MDGGITEDGLPWFAMEYIDGDPIDLHCDRHKLSTEERLGLFTRACSAVQYAHSKLVVHRDLKPSNILVGSDDRVVLLDFGIARLLADHPMNDPTVTAGERLMTPMYASPEQIRGDVPSTSSDVYALGVLLHVLLTGTYPYRLARHDGYEVARAVLEQEPEHPSASVLRQSEPETSVVNGSAVRGRVPRPDLIRLSRRLRGDLDAIVLKAIEKEPAERYATVEQFETDVHRHLAGMPVVAQPGSRLYTASKFLRRHRIGASITALIAVLVISFAAVMTIQGSKIRTQAERITLERDRAEDLGRNFLNVFSSVAPGSSSLGALEILDSATARIHQMSGNPELRSRMMVEMARAYHRIDLNDRASALLQAALQLRRTLSPGNPVAVAETLHLLGTVHLAKGDVTGSIEVLTEALALQRRHLGEDNRQIARTLVDLASALRMQKHYPEARRLSREAVALDRSRGERANEDLAASTASVAAVAADAGDYGAAVRLFREAISLLRGVNPADSPELAAMLFGLGSALHRAGEHAEGDLAFQQGSTMHRRILTAAIVRGTARASEPGSGGPDPVNDAVQLALINPPPAAPGVRDMRATFNSRIVFTTDRHDPDAVGHLGNHEIYVMNPDGSGQRRLTNDKTRDMGASISRDGTRIAFARQSGGGVDIFVMNADGSGQRRITNFSESGGRAGEPSWAPDGRRIVFGTRIKEMALYTINLDGTGLVKLTDELMRATLPAWSPDGRKIAFNSGRHGATEIYVMNADGTNQVRLTFNDAIDNRPSWSPDGKRIAFHSTRDGNSEIYVMNADGSDQTRLTTFPEEDGHPSWSPDGRSLVFHRRVLGHGQLHVMNADGTNVKRLTDLSATAFSAFANWGNAPP